MIYGNIYDQSWRNAQLLKELNIEGDDNQDEEENPDYTADDDTEGVITPTLLMLLDRG